MDLTLDLTLAEGLSRPWALAAVAGGVVVLLAWWSRRRRHRGEAVVLARTSRLRRLPGFQRRLRRQRRTGLLLTLGSLLVVAGSAVVLARPDVVEAGRPDARSRDLMLCLDASPSMAKDNLAVVSAVRRVVAGLEGDRVGLVIWSGAAVVVFPLTDDYAYVDEQLDRAEAAFSGASERFFAGVNLNDQGASLIGDGLVSCVNRFDRPASQRTRAVLLASDNEPFGDTLFTLPQAAAYAEERDVLVYALAASSLAKPQRATPLEELTAAARSTGGTLVQLQEEGGTDRLIDRIDDLEKARAVEPPRPVSREAPALGVLLALAGLPVLGAGWLVGRERRRRGAGR
ncbi:VWA domain-containing protein [Nocardioides sp.]|uniref:VWA domain-containing protein n=1 Tax=Nocardioides sp. TaxID=35761 RepID=UPI001A359D48|nr:VWA domain-containing protein [Nocardioides sp.]MBJ7357257.1 VWA domain-containing protein [Nocardioides sp.]